MPDTVINNPQSQPSAPQPENGGGSGGWAIAVIVLILIVLFLWLGLPRLRGTSSDNTNDGTTQVPDDVNVQVGNGADTGATAQ